LRLRIAIQRLTGVAYKLQFHLVVERIIRKLELENGIIPFDEWFESLRDSRMQAAVDSRLARMRAGNFGDHKSVGGGVFELRLQIGPGLRVYLAQQGAQVVILLGGGDKSTQVGDIARAQKLWKQFKTK
jgi:putative addiction module killer protein